MKKTGFTLIETLVAVTILVIGVIGPLSLASRGISDGLFAQNQLTANLLAQEAIETIVNKRNSNVVNIVSVNGAFDDIGGTLTVGFTNDAVKIDGQTGDIDLNGCTGTNGCKMNNIGGFYKNVDDSNPGIFYRKISLTKIENDEMQIKVVMTWYNKSVVKKFTIVENIYAK